MMIIALLLWSFILVQFICSQLLKWKEDPELSRLSGNIHCDFPILNGNDYHTFDDIPFMDIPFIVQNLTDQWLAHENWQKENLLKKYGHRYVRSGSEVSIVYSAGNSEFSSTLEDFVKIFDKYTDNQSLHYHESEMGDQFLFDTTILHAIPELRNDFLVPNIFQDWDHPEREQNYRIWHMLSLGPSRSGLSYHNHGQTWIAVVHGMKRWFVYPPGYGPPRDIDSKFHPTLTVWEWFVHYYPKLLRFQKPGLSDSDHFEAGFRPLECVQKAGDVLYLPSLWNHMTLNIGETIGVGAQEGLEMDERLQISLEAYNKNPKNYEALKDIGISLYYKSLFELEQFRRKLNFEENTRIIQLKTDQEVGNYFDFTGDSSLVIRYNNEYWDQNDLISELLSQIDISSDIIIVPDLKLDSNHLLLQVFYGLDSPDWQQNGLCSMNNSMIIHNIQSWKIPSKLFPYIIQGTVGTLPMKIKLELEKSIFFFRKALEVKPLQPDSIQLISEVYGKLGKLEEVKDLVVSAEQGYDRMQQTYKISKKSLASLYFKLVLICENVGLHESIIRLAGKCIHHDDSLIFCWKHYFQQIRNQQEDVHNLQSQINRFYLMIQERFHYPLDLDLTIIYEQPEEILEFIDSIIQRYY